MSTLTQTYQPTNRVSTYPTAHVCEYTISGQERYSPNDVKEKLAYDLAKRILDDPTVIFRSSYVPHTDETIYQAKVASVPLSTPIFSSDEGTINYHINGVYLTADQLKEAVYAHFPELFI